jgi:NADH:ubiquinone oxidoreductase subunit E
MIKKKLKKWYPTKKQEDNANLLERIQDAANQIHRSQLNRTANWVIMGTDVAEQLNTLYPNLTTTESANYTNTWCGTTFLTTSANTNYSLLTVASASTYFTTSTFQ